jgi:enterochelin esterase-like enzyme
MLRFTFDHSQIFPGTTRTYWIYVPAQYDGKIPACVYVDQDGRQWNADVVFDNLIAKKEMPVTIGVFVTPGVVPTVSPDALPRFNRSYEYDALGDHYVRFILDELLPDVATKTASDGRPLLLSQNATDRAIGGSSSGAMAAFTAAWERPDAFSRVFSAVGSYTDLRGGEVYPSLIRKYEPKPIRVFLQSGTNDNNHYGGDWWMANQSMERSLEFSGYEVNHVWGEGDHNGRMGAAVFPDAMRWLWNGWPAPPKTGETKNAVLHEILLPGEGWQPLNGTFTNSKGLVANAAGEVVFFPFQTSIPHPGADLLKIGLSGNVSPSPLGGLDLWGAHAFGPDGYFYYACATQVGENLDSSDQNGRLIPGHSILYVSIYGAYPDHFQCLIVAHDGNLYFSNRQHNRICLLKPNGNESTVLSDGPEASALALSPDQSLLYVADAQSNWVYSYQIQADGSLLYGQKFFSLETPYDTDDGHAFSLAVDTAGRLYAATSLGIEVCDQAGRVNAILPLPRNVPATAVCFGGPNFDILYAAGADKIYSRKLHATGQPAWAAPVKPAPPKL